FSPDGFRLALTDGQRVFRWDLRTDKRQEVYKSNNMPFRHVRFSADGKTLLATHPPGIKLLDPGTGKERAAIEAYYGTIGASGRYVFVTPDNLTISAYSATTGKKTATLAAKKGKTEVGRSPFNDIVIESPGGKWVVGLGAVLFEANTQKEIHHWQTQPKPLQFAFTPDEKTLVTTDSKGTMIVWELPSLRQRHVAPKTWAPTGLSAISSDNRTAALMQDAGTMVLFDLVEGVALARVIGFSAPVARMAFSPDGKSLVTGCTDGTIQFWCPVTGAQRLNVPAHFGSVTVLAFSPNGAILATGGGQTVRLWLARE
ncbi:MAG TPA: hypothetical protein VE988_23100, partial [Gemmataceae bacterium]|nr:hypothetical protein [Gemmataceae bacterium]